MLIAPLSVPPPPQLSSLTRVLLLLPSFDWIQIKHSTTATSSSTPPMGKPRLPSTPRRRWARSSRSRSRRASCASSLAATSRRSSLEKNGFYFDKLSTPETILSRLNLTGKLLMFEISNTYSATSPTITFEKLRSRVSGAILTSGLTPVPFNSTETIVESE